MKTGNLMSFSDALVALAAGNYVGRVNEIYYFEPCFSDTNDELLNIIVHDGEGDEWNVDFFEIDDVLATDWTIIE